MNSALLVFSAILVILQLKIPRRYVTLPILLATCHSPHTAEIANLSTVRIVILAGILRAFFSHSLKFTTRAPTDILFIIFSLITVISAFAHDPLYSNPLIFRVGLILNVVGAYIYGRSYITTKEEFIDFAKCLVIAILPLAILMIDECITGRNFYSLLGARSDPIVRLGEFRAIGPFGTPILSGTVGGITIAIFFVLYRNHRTFFIIAIASALAIIGASSSSGPIATTFIGLSLLALWRYRVHIRTIKRLTVAMLIFLSFAMERPVWYLISRIDFTGGSTGWHRSYLIDTAFAHIQEWWFLGTDYTGHWMPYSLPTHIPGHRTADLTNYYVHLGVIGGLGLTLTLIAILYLSIKKIGKSMSTYRDEKNGDKYLLWCIGCTLFLHAITLLTVSYFDQIFVFLYLTIGLAQSICDSALDRKLPTFQEPQKSTTSI